MWHYHVRTFMLDEKQEYKLKKCVKCCVWKRYRIFYTCILVIDFHFEEYWSLHKTSQIWTFWSFTIFVRPWFLGDLKTVRLCFTLSFQLYELWIIFSCWLTPLSHQNNCWKRFWANSFYVMAVNVWASAHDHGGFEETVQITKNDLDHLIVVRLSKKMVFCYQW